ncbi:biopolymer transporter ExbD [bacterium]|nr:biopolymer transporter ExbD [bacterium]
MANGSIIRLIDVVLIILVGFISVSDLRQKSQITLPQKKETPVDDTESEQIAAMIFIQEDGYQVMVEEDSVWFNPDDLEGVKSRLEEYKQNYDKPLVAIDPSDSSPVQFTVNMIDVCSSLELPKSVLVRKED